MPVWARHELAELEATLDDTNITADLRERRLFPEIDEIHDTLGKPPPKPTRIQVCDLCDLWVRQAVTRSLADQSRTIRVPVHMSDAINKVVHTSQRMLNKVGREPMPEEIAEKLLMPLDKVRTILNAI